MSKTLAIAWGIGLMCVAIAVGAIFYVQRGAHLVLDGKILKVRTAPLDENSSVGIIDFRVSNSSNVTFVVRTATLLLEDPSGNQAEGQSVSDVDAARVFQGIPMLGEKYNSTILMNDKIRPHTTKDRMLAARFEAPESKLDSRKRFILRLEDVDGPVSEISEKK